MKVFKGNCQLRIAWGLCEEDREDFVAGAGQGHLQGKGFGPTMKDEEQIHILHVFSKNNMSISFCYFFGFITQPGSNSYRSSSFCCCYIKFHKTALSPTPPLLTDMKVMPQCSLLNLAQEQRALSEISVHSSVAGRC